MIVTPDVIREEFIGTFAQVASSPHAGYLDVSGQVVDETRNTFTLSREGTKKCVVKEQAVFQFRFSNGTVIEIDGKLLVGRPEDRLKKQVKRLW